MCGDHLQVLASFPDNSIDLIITSPPYDDLRSYQGYRYIYYLFGMTVSRILKQGGVMVYIIGDQVKHNSESLSSYRHIEFFHSICNLNLHDTMIYEKSCFANPSSTRSHQIWEYMFVLSKGKPKTIHLLKDRPNKTKYNFGKSRRKVDGSMTYAGDTERIQLDEFGNRFNIWRYNTAKGSIATDEYAHTHPAIFPEDLAEDHIRMWSNEGDVVLDPMCGSGTVCKMAHKLHRNYIGIDCSQEYCDIAKKRVNYIDQQTKEKHRVKKLDHFFPQAAMH